MSIARRAPSLLGSGLYSVQKRWMWNAGAPGGCGLDMVLSFSGEGRLRSRVAPEVEIRRNGSIVHSDSDGRYGRDVNALDLRGGGARRMIDHRPAPLPVERRWGRRGLLN